MSSLSPDPAETIAHALARLRFRGGPRSGHRPRLDGPHPHDHHDHHGGPPHSDGRHHGGMMRGGPARVRMLEALAAASAPLSVSEIGEVIGVDQPRASRLVQQGVEMGLLAREADPADARRTRIVLTEQGRRAAQRTRGQRRELVGEALADFSEAERTELARLLTKLADNWGA